MKMLQMRAVVWVYTSNCFMYLSVHQRTALICLAFVLTVNRAIVLCVCIQVVKGCSSVVVEFEYKHSMPSPSLGIRLQTMEKRAEFVNSP